MNATATIDPNITMRELLEQFPGAQRAMFRKYHIGGCSSCGFSPEETLAGVCARNENVDVNEAIDALRAGDRVEIQVVRGASTLTFGVKLTSRPSGTP